MATPQSFAKEVDTVATPDQVHRRFLFDWTPLLSRAGYQLVAQSQAGFSYEKRYRSGWIYFFCIILFPIGLVLLATEKKRAPIQVAIAEHDGGSRVTVVGEAFDDVAGYFMQLTPDHHLLAAPETANAVSAPSTSV